MNYKIELISPIKAANRRKSNVRKTKNDTVGTYIIIKALTFGNYSLITFRDINYLKLKGLYRSRHNLVTMRSKFKIQLVPYLVQIFPELTQFFKGNIHLNVSYQLLKKYSIPKQISSLHLTKYSNILHDNSHGKYGKQDAICLRELDKASVGIDNPSLSLQIKHAILQIELYNEQIAEIEAFYKSILDEMDSSILTIPGMSYKQAAIIVSCIGDINRFEHSCQLLAYAGLVPSVVQSGNFQAKPTRMSKRNSGMLRYSLVFMLLIMLF